MLPAKKLIPHQKKTGQPLSSGQQKDLANWERQNSSLVRQLDEQAVDGDSALAGLEMEKMHTLMCHSSWSALPAATTCQVQRVAYAVRMERQRIW